VWVIDIARVLDFLGRWTLVRFFFAELVVLLLRLFTHTFRTLSFEPSGSRSFIGVCWSWEGTGV
jgi:hypothetical protein